MSAVSRFSMDIPDDPGRRQAFRTEAGIFSRGIILGQMNHKFDILVEDYQAGRTGSFFYHHSNERVPLQSG